MQHDDSGTLRSSPPTAPARNLCEHCGSTFVPKRQTKGRFCSATCFRSWWNDHGQREAAKKGLSRLEQLRAEGRDPRSTERAAWKRKMAFRDTALRLDEAEAVDDESLWAERGEYWQGIADPRDGLPSLWERRRAEPLLLSGHGVRIRIRHGALEIRHGFTHHPQEPRTQLLFPGDRRMPSRLVLLDVDGALTFDVIVFLARNDIALVMLDWRGRVVSTLGGKATQTDVRLRRAQLDAYQNGVALRIAADLIRRKVSASTETLSALPSSERVERGIHRLEGISELLDDDPADTEALRILEARAAASYFAAWLDIPLRWKGTARLPIPREWRRMPLRGSLLGELNRHSNHPVTSALNYAYGVLESQVRQAASALGLDVAIGYLHVPAPRRDALVFDLMEPWRPVVDRGVLGFVQEHTFSTADVFLTERGVCRLHPQLARAVASLVPPERHVRDYIRGATLPLFGAA
jgi:CRISPR-associated protein Cas1